MEKLVGPKTEPWTILALMGSRGEEIPLNIVRCDRSR